MLSSSSVGVSNWIKPPMGFGFSLYGMRKLALAEAIAAVADIGYDCLEIPALADWPGAPENLGTAQRESLKELIEKRSLRLSALMENLQLLAESTVHGKNLERLKAAGQLGRDLSPELLPVIETIMGGSPAMWEEVKSRMVDRLGTWAQVAEQSQIVLAIKAHVSGAAHLPEHIRWLLDQVRSPWLKAVFDHSHFQLRQVALEDGWRMLSSDTVFIHIKDSIGDLKKFKFALPGEGSIPYADYFAMLARANCKADVVVEVSSQLHNQPEYDAIQAAKKSFAAIAKARATAGIDR